jgi:signal transduction histidine kinase
MSTLQQILNEEKQEKCFSLKRVGYFSSIVLAGLLLAAGMVIYGLAHLRVDGVMEGWVGYLPLGAMAYGSLLLLAVAVIEVRVRHVREGCLVVRACTLDDLVNHLTRCQEKERAELSARLHDDVGGMLTALKMELEGVKRSKERRESEIWGRVDLLFEKLYAEVRGLSGLLFPRAIGALGLKGALEELTDRFKGGTLQIHLELFFSSHEIPHEVSLCVLRIVQEGIVNAGRYSEGKHVWVRLEQTPDGLNGSIDDDGLGWGTSEDGMGLTLIQERVRRLGGRVDFCPSPRGGARLAFELPWRRAADQDRAAIRKRLPHAGGRA